MKKYGKHMNRIAVVAAVLVLALCGLGIGMAVAQDPGAAGMLLLPVAVGAVANTKSNQITNADATPLALTSHYISGGVLREWVGFVEVAAADDDTSVYRLVRVPSNIRISSILVANDAITGGTVYDIGVYQSTVNGGAVVDADFFATNVDLSSALGFTEYLLEATVTDLDKVEKMLWELLGLSADPQRTYDICLTGDTVGTAAGTIAMKLKGVV